MEEAALQPESGLSFVYGMNQTAFRISMDGIFIFHSTPSERDP